MITFHRIDILLSNSETWMGGRRSTLVSGTLAISLVLFGLSAIASADPIGLGSPSLTGSAVQGAGIKRFGMFYDPINFGPRGRTEVSRPLLLQIPNAEHANLDSEPVRTRI